MANPHNNEQGAERERQHRRGLIGRDLSEIEKRAMNLSARARRLEARSDAVLAERLGLAGDASIDLDSLDGNDSGPFSLRGSPLEGQMLNVRSAPPRKNEQAAAQVLKHRRVLIGRDIAEIEKRATNLSARARRLELLSDIELTEMLNLAGDAHFASENLESIDREPRERDADDAYSGPFSLWVNPLERDILNISSGIVTAGTAVATFAGGVAPSGAGDLIVCLEVSVTNSLGPPAAADVSMNLVSMAESSFTPGDADKTTARIALGRYTRADNNDITWFTQYHFGSLYLIVWEHCNEEDQGVYRLVSFKCPSCITGVHTHEILRDRHDSTAGVETPVTEATGVGACDYFDFNP